MAQIGRLAPPKPKAFDLDFLGAPLDETPEERFARTGTPQEDPANVAAPEGPDLSFLGDEQPEVAPYDWTIAGAPLPDGLRPVGDLIAGMNSSLAGAAGVAVDDIDLIMRNLGMEGMLDKPGEGKAAVTAAMEKLGIGADKKKAVNQFLADIGEASGENLLMLSAFFAAAPMMMGAQGGGTLANLSRQMGESLIRNPLAAGVTRKNGLVATNDIGVSPEIGST